MRNPFRHGSRRRPLLFLTIAAVAISGAIVPAMAQAKPANVKVMSRNLYLGANLLPAIGAPNPGAAMFAAGGIYDHVLDMNFDARAKLLAAEIEVAKPDLIGLQEVSLWRRGQRVAAGGVPDGPATPSTEVIVDYLDVLRHELSRLGLDYKVAVKQQEADIELPVDRGTAGAPDGVPEFDGRLTMYDVILVRKATQIQTKNPQSNNYSLKLSVTTALGPVTVDRGWTSIDVTKKQGKSQKKFRFVNTHLEAFSAQIRRGQASELVSPNGAFVGNQPMILVGDLNSDPDDASIQGPPFSATPTRNAAAYGLIVDGDAEEEGAGFVDLGVTVPTCCFGDDLLDAAPVFSSRIDHVVARGTVEGVNASLIGVDPTQRTGSGLWPTDHGGVVAKLKVG